MDTCLGTLALLAEIDFRGYTSIWGRVCLRLCLPYQGLMAVDGL